jgi:hypothetical protein
MRSVEGPLALLRNKVQLRMTCKTENSCVPRSAADNQSNVHVYRDNRVMRASLLVFKVYASLLLG